MILIKNKRIIKIFMCVCCIMISCNAFATNFLYELQSNKNSNVKKEESSISTIATPEFTFQSESQILMEASTGKILYANNEDEQLLPASVTKVMTMLLIMEQIDSRKVKL